MRARQIDGLSRAAAAALAGELDRRGFRSSVEGLYWLPVPEHLLSPEQKAHAAECGPYALALEILKTGLRLEYLVRANATITCSCVAPADPACEAFMSAYLDGMLKELGLEI